MKTFLSTCLLLVIISPNNTFKEYKDRGCAASCTTRTYSFNAVDIMLRSARKCCKTPLCNSRRNKQPNRISNGLVCSNLDASGSEIYKGRKNIHCYNEQTKCAEFVLVHDDSEVPDKVVKGCATPNFCALAENSMLSKYFNGTITQVQCSDAVPSPKKPKSEW